MNSDELYLGRAIELARKGIGDTFPNPNVGAVVVSDGRIVGEGYHKKKGEPHAEVEAINEAGSEARGGTIYLNLEPCCHYGTTPPCTERIIQAGLKRVVFSIYDPDPRVSGKGARILRENGIEVETGVKSWEAMEINLPFIHRCETGKPLVILKLALTLDGCLTVEPNGWFTSEESRKYVHYLRALTDAVAVGIGTVKSDNPVLDRRFFERKLPPPVRCVFDSKLDFHLESSWFNDGERIMIYCSEDANTAKAESLKEAGAEVIPLSENNGRIDLERWIEDLSERSIHSVLVEGGAGIATSFIKKRLADRMFIFFASRISGKKGLSFFMEDEEPDWIKGGGLNPSRVSLSGSDIVAVYDNPVIEGYFKRLAGD
ncbi:MAG: bifunctional diaminohydroxyphosphoribosylaminopyrimidine deaminase/5-amino-6-(5-phosphoribosylamino)uracil reductase RibD [Candidatus Krumholzibacteriota bacterium]|nr:bifunctional diaminohydroxyphosphoribosylaminopyrimidine deaminase/5-amino-6-(5-phosphoribosylamino)uracil reductase RibD [Candidatus Krumholzibacteriota bacterium]